MQPPIDATLVSLAPHKGSRISWFMAGIGCLYFLWLGVGFTTRILLVFIKLFGGLGVELPLPTRILLFSHPWFLQIVFIGTAMLTVATRLVEFSPRQTRIINIVFIFVGAVLPALIVWCLYMPLFSLIGKLAGAR